MFPRTSLTQLIPDRLRELKERLERTIWHPVEAHATIYQRPAQAEHINFDDLHADSFTAVEQLPHVWGQMWDQSWFRVELPDEVFGKGYYLKWDDEAEVTVYAEGMPWCGIDAAHHYAPLPDTAQDLWIEGVVCRTGIWFNDGKSISEEGSTLRGVSIWQRDELAWSSYFDFLILFDLLGLEYKKYMEGQGLGDGYASCGGYHPRAYSISPLYRRILQGLDRFADAYDRSGLEVSAPLLKELYAQLPAYSPSIDAILTGHSHLDLVWLWPERVGEAKAVHTFSTVNRLFSQSKDLYFGFSQPASYDAVARRSPKLMEAVKQHIQDGRWEATGATDVESDTQLPCGEALARSFLIGQERFEDIRGERAKVMWLPDVFGYSGCLPQIMRQTGVEAFYTSKTAWSAVSRFPHSSFVWKGVDGSEVLVHLGQEPGYNGGVHVSHLQELEEKHQQVGIHNEVLVPTGYGDGGGGPTEEMLERTKRLHSLASMPKCRWGRIEDFFSRLEEVRADLPEWNGEIYLEFHRGVQTTHGELKANFRAAERSLQLREAALAVSAGGIVPIAEWRRVIFIQFHDAIPGSSIREVTDEINSELSQFIITQRDKAGQRLGGSDRSDYLFNPLPFARSVLHAGLHYDLPPLGSAALAHGRSPTAISASATGLSNAFVQAEFNQDGEISQLVMKGESIAIADPINQLWTYPDFPHSFAAWDVDRGTLGNGQRIVGSSPAEVEQGLGYATVSFRRRVSEQSTVTVRYRLESEAQVIHLEYDVDWQDSRSLLKSVFPTSYNGQMARYGAPFGSALRPQHGGDDRSEAMWEVPGSRWACLADDGEDAGLAVLTEAKYGFSARNGTIGVSLVRSAEIIHGSDHLGIRTLSTECPFSDMGRAEIKLALAAYSAVNERAMQPAALAEHLYQPALAVADPVAIDWGFALDGGDTLVPVWTQPFDDGSIVVRCTETLGRRGRARLATAEGVCAELVDLSGNSVTCAQLNDDCISFTPYALFGIKLYRG